MPKVGVFLSHISEEAALAKLFRERLTDSFLSMIEIFVSSDPGSLDLGSKWVDRITEELRTCVAMLILCSETSVTRPWINFEAGAGWIRDIPVIPICHTGMRPNTLPLPLKLLKGIEANQESELRNLYARMATALGSSPPAHDFADFAARVVDFEQEYGFIRHVREHVDQILALAPRIAPLFAPSTSVTKFDGEADQADSRAVKHSLRVAQSTRNVGLHTGASWIRGYWIG